MHIHLATNALHDKYNQAQARENVRVERIKGTSKGKQITFFLWSAGLKPIHISRHELVNFQHLTVDQSMGNQLADFFQSY